MRILKTLSSILILFLFFTATAMSDWVEVDGHKMHFPQLPNTIGWDVNATHPLILADDWTCSETGWVKDIHFWGSWMHGVEGQVVIFILSIHEDIPADPPYIEYSRPGAILWEKEISSYIVADPVDPPGLEGWYDPGSGELFPDDHVNYYQYNIFLEEPDWFLQEKGNIYWLNISAILVDPVTTQWGWKSSLNHWNDDAVFSGLPLCVAPDNGTGTITYPADCEFTSPDEKMMIIDGLPPGTTMEMEATFYSFACTDGPMCAMGLAPGVCEGPGGSLGGTGSCFEGTLQLELVGTGTLAGFTRTLLVPMFAEIHHAPRVPGDPNQLFTGDLYRWYGELFGDPDFCSFRIIAGTDYGLPSPGQTELDQLPSGDFAVDSFFDITYQIEFEGCPGSIIDGYMGVTTATIRMEQGGRSDWVDLYEPPDFSQSLDLAFVITGESPECGPAYDGQSCLDVICPNPEDDCVPVCVEYNLATGTTNIIDCQCLDPNSCYIEIPTGGAPSCVVPDNGTGTANLPPVGCDYTSPGEKWMIIDGLPPATTIEMEGTVEDFTNITSGSGGSLGGEYEQFDATLDLTVTGTGDLAGFNRHLAVPISCETHSAPRTAGDPIQSFAADMYEMLGELFGDPDFCELTVTAGTNFGLPSPGYTTLRELPSGDFAVESFFDITYRIEFDGCPGSQLDGYAGTTTATIRIKTGSELLVCSGDCPTGEICERIITDNGNGTIDICCQCQLAVCEPNQYGTGCKTSTCVNPNEECLPVCTQMNLETGEIEVIECECRDETIESCQVDMTSGGDNVCVAADNGTGTADLPPVGCGYTNPDDKWIIAAGLPYGTTIEMEGVLTDFVSVVSGSGGSLGGEYEQFDATLDLTVSGTGSLLGFNRHLSVPVTCETHSAPRTPGNPVQSFATVIFEMTGELFGDPDFCEFIVRAGSNLGLPGPGHTILRELPSGDFAVESFFDITYQIEFEGCPASQLEDYAGTTTATIRIRTGAELPVCTADCPEGEVCREVVTYNTDGTVDVCCQCVPEVCEPTPNGLGCRPGTCVAGGEECQPTCLNYRPILDQTAVIACECAKLASCYAIPPDNNHGICAVPHNGSGSADMPPEGCEYTSPDEKWMIIDGLPPGSTIEMEGVLMDFANIVVGSGGSLGGQFEQFDATLDLTVTGTGDFTGFNRHLAVPMSGEIHSGPRSPGSTVQLFATDMFRLGGELFGDPDFCELRVIAGTDYALSSPGETELLELPDGSFAVESFFDITYQIEFEGCPASQLDGFSGITTATIRIQAGSLPGCTGPCPTGQFCEKVVTVNPDESFDICCICSDVICDCSPGEADGSPPLNILDIVYVINYVYKSGPAPLPYALCSGDADCDCTINILDIVYQINYIYKNGPAPCSCAQWLLNCPGGLRK